MIKKNLYLILAAALLAVCYFNPARAYSLMAEDKPGGYSHGRITDHYERITEIVEVYDTIHLNIKCTTRTVPIVVPGVDLTYYEPWTEGVHYLRITRAEEIPEKINSISENQWNEMSNECILWYNRNASPEGSYKTTERILKNEFNYRTV